MLDLTCPECRAQAVFLRMRWPCYKCPNGHDWRIGALPNGEPLGTLADPELRALRVRAHLSFDRLWQTGLMGRKEAYTWLSRQLGLKREDAHIGRLNAGQCRELLKRIKEHLTPEKLQQAWENQRMG